MAENTTTLPDRRCVCCDGPADGFTRDEQPICKACVPKSKRRRKLIVIKTDVSGSGDDRKYGCESTLPMSSADAVESENAAVRIMQAVNAQLDFAGSDLRLVVYDIKQKKYVKVTIPD